MRSSSSTTRMRMIFALVVGTGTVLIIPQAGRCPSTDDGRCCAGEITEGFKTETPNELCSPFGVLLSLVLNTLSTALVYGEDALDARDACKSFAHYVPLRKG